MSSLLPHRPTVENTRRANFVVELGDDDSREIFSVLASETAREILAALDEEPAPPSNVVDHVDTSIQNVQYHIKRLRSAGLVAKVDTWYSSRGTEMAVYAPTVDQVVLRITRDAHSDPPAECSDQ